MWGNGYFNYLFKKNIRTYFAVNSSYSESYSEKYKQMFYAQVSLGETIHLKPDNSLKMPPKKDNSDIRYDSVSGETGGSIVYIIYEHTAYPSYLITYN
jgi:hypothetical protein